MKPMLINILLSLLVIGLGQPAQARAIDAVATFSIIGDVVRHVGGESVNVHVLVGNNGDVHEYEPTPKDAVILNHADIIFENGLGLEHWMDKIYQASNAHAKRVIVAKGIRVRALDHLPNEVDPHAWQDVHNMIAYANNVRDALITADPANAEKYQLNAAKYTTELSVFDAWVIEQLKKITKRNLVTNHDALGYFAGRYGLRVVGCAIPSATTDAADPSAKQTATLLEIIRKEGVKVIFAENMANPKVAEVLAQEAGVKISSSLYTDALGENDSDGHDYISMMRHNVNTIVQLLGGS